MLLKMNEKICAPSCEHCGEPMTFEHMTPKSALIPELRTFVCSECGDVETIDVIITVREDEPISNPREELMDLTTSVASAEESPDVEIGKPVGPTTLSLSETKSCLSVVQSAQNWHSQYATAWFDGARRRRVLVQ